MSVYAGYLKRSRGSVIFDAANALLLILLCALMLYPFLYVVSRSVMPAAERAARPYSLIPITGLDWDGYEYVLASGSRLLSGLRVTLFRTIVGTVLTVLVSAM